MGRPKKQQIHVRYDKRFEHWKVCGRDSDGPWTRRFEFLNTKKVAVGFAVLEAHRLADQGIVVELYIHRMDGAIQDRRTYPRSADPRRSRG